MVNHTQPSRRPISPGRAKLWNPSKTLGIINTDYDCLTCVGYAPSCGRRCRNPIRADNRALIMRTLDEIAYLPPDSPVVLSRLRAVAGPALCVRNHQSQVETVVMQWQRKVQLLNPQIGERKPAKLVQSSRPQEPTRDRRVKDLENQLKEMREAVTKLQEEINSQRVKSQEREEPEERAGKDRREEEKERKRRRSEEQYREMRRKESERLEKERLEKEKREKEEKQRREREQAAANERIRQRAQKKCEERERERREKQKKERKEWDQLWAKYQERWAQFKASASDTREGNIRDAIPWPVKSGSYRDVKDSSVKEFFQKSLSKDENMVKIMRKECLKWHFDTRRSWLRDSRLSDADKMMVEMICRVVTELLNRSAGRSAEFLD